MAQSVPVHWGHRPAQSELPERLPPVRQTVRRSNQLVGALSVPRVTLYNARSVWAKWDNLAEDISQRQTDLCLLTEVWQVKESKKHQKAVESMMEMNGIQYVSTPQPGARRGGGTAIACREEN